jgi:hypothetical protein
MASLRYADTVAPGWRAFIGGTLLRPYERSVEMSLRIPDVVGAKSEPSRKSGESIRGGDPIAAASERGVEMSLDAADKSVCATIQD